MNQLKEELVKIQRQLEATGSANSKNFQTGIKSRTTKKEIAEFWFAIGELYDFRAHLAEELPPESWQNKLSKLGREDLVMAYLWILHEKSPYPPSLMDVLRCAGNAAYPKKPETAAEFAQRRIEEQKQIPAKYATREVADRYRAELREKLGITKTPEATDE